MEVLISVLIQGLTLCLIVDLAMNRLFGSKLLLTRLLFGLFRFAVLKALIGVLIMAAWLSRVVSRLSMGFLPSFTFKMKPKGAYFISPRDSSLSGKGLLVGDKARLTREASMRHLLVLAGTGSGKTAAVLIPNIFELAKNKEQPCLLVCDPKASIFEATSGFLEARGYEIFRIDPQSPCSNAFNPLKHANTTGEIKQLALSLANAADFKGKESKSIWSKFAINLITQILLLLKRMPAEYQHLGNALKLVRMIGDDGKALDELLAAYANQEIYDQFLFLFSKTPEVLSSVTATAEMMLDKLDDERLLKLLAFDDLDLASFRTAQAPRVIFITFQPLDSQYMGFVASLLYKRIFDLSLAQLPDKGTRDLYCLLDEAGNMPKIDGLGVISTYARQYGLSLTLFLQSMSQLELIYGHQEAKIIVDGGMSNRLYLGSGISSEDSRQLKQRLGLAIKQTETGTEEKSLLEQTEIEQLDWSKSILLQQGRPPALLKKKSYNQKWKYRRHSRFPPADLQDVEKPAPFMIDPEGPHFVQASNE